MYLQGVIIDPPFQTSFRCMAGVRGHLSNDTTLTLPAAIGSNVCENTQCKSFNWCKPTGLSSIPEKNIR